MGLISRLNSRPLLLDALIAVVIGALTIGGSYAAGLNQSDMTHLDWLAYALLVAGAASLVVRRRSPVLTIAVTFLATLFWIWLRYPYGPVFIYLAVAIYSAAAWRNTRTAVIAVLLAVAAHVPWSLWGERNPDGLLFTVLTTSLWLATPVALGIAVSTQRRADAQARLEERHRHTYEERLRMAQEVHDVVGHSLAVISMNAGAALHVLTKQPGPPQVEQSLRAIRQASSGALDELRSTLATFTGALDPVTIAPGLARLPDLVTASNVDGLAVTLTSFFPDRHDVGENAKLRADVDLAAFRIAQEALANVVRHAGATKAEVAVTYGESSLQLTITDNGAGGPVKPGGSGLRSMAQRAESLGGKVIAGPVDGGFEVRAVLPYGEQA